MSESMSRGSGRGRSRVPSEREPGTRFIPGRWGHDLTDADVPHLCPFLRQGDKESSTPWPLLVPKEAQKKGTELLQPSW